MQRGRVTRALAIALAAAATALAGLLALPSSASAAPWQPGAGHERPANAGQQRNPAQQSMPDVASLFADLLDVRQNPFPDWPFGPMAHSDSVANGRGNSSASSSASVTTGSVSVSVHGNASSGHPGAAQPPPPPAPPAPNPPPAAPPAQPAAPPPTSSAPPKRAADATVAVRHAPLQAPALITVPASPAPEPEPAPAPQPGAPQQQQLEAVTPTSLLTAPGTGLLLAALFGFAGGVGVVVFAAGRRGHGAR
jgi:hypothetical protein